MTSLLDTSVRAVTNTLAQWRGVLVGGQSSKDREAAWCARLSPPSGTYEFNREFLNGKFLANARVKLYPLDQDGVYQVSSFVGLDGQLYDGNRGRTYLHTLNGVTSVIDKAEAKMRLGMIAERPNSASHVSTPKKILGR